MPGEFLGLLSVVSSFPVAFSLHPDENHFNFFKIDNYIDKAPKIWLIETVQQSIKNINLGADEIWVLVSTVPLQNGSFSKSFNLARFQDYQL